MGKRSHRTVPARAPRRHRTSAAPLALMYAVLIVYASLSPFTGWKPPANVPWLGFGHMPWPRWWTAFDVVSNLLGYMPMGALLFGAQVRSGRGAASSAAWAVAGGAVLSLCMESLQNYLPQRVPSGMDWVLNVAGTLLGLAVAWAVWLFGGLDRWQAVRDRWFIAHSAGGIALLLSWPVGLLFPTPVPMGVGQVIGRLQELAVSALDGTPWAPWVDDWVDAPHTLAPLSRGSETLAILLGLMAPCFVAFAIVRPPWRRAVMAAAAALLGFAATTLSTALSFGPQHALAWLTPPVAPALLGALLLAALLLALPRRAAAGVGLVGLTALLAIVTQAPSDPYYAESLQGWEQGRFIRFHGLAQWVGWLWPYAALSYLLMRVAARDDA